VEVITFNFEEQLQDILADRNLFGDFRNLVFNVGDEDKWLQYNNAAGTMFEVFDRMWYQKYAKLMVKDPTTEFCLFAGLYVDKSETVTYQQYSFEPLITFTPLLNNKCRNCITSPSVIALLSDLYAKSSEIKTSTRTKQANKGTSIHNYHKCFKVTLQSQSETQQRVGMHTFLRLGDDIREKMVLVPLAFILGDAKSQDTTTGRYGGHICKRKCCACNVAFEESDDPERVFQWVLCCLDWLAARHQVQTSTSHSNS
jgi:hypothetical protein